MKKQIAVFASVLCAMVCVSACSNELEVAETPTADEDLAVKIGFVSALDRLKASGALTQDGDTTVTRSKLKASNDDGFKVVHFKIARPKTNCKSGFGVCDLMILGIPIGPQSSYEKAIAQIEEQITESECITILEGNVQEGQYVELQFKLDPASQGLNKVPDFCVDEEIEKGNIINTEEVNVKIPAGKYQFDNTIGENGGFRVPVETINSLSCEEE